MRYTAMKPFNVVCALIPLSKMILTDLYMDLISVFELLLCKISPQKGIISVTNH